MNFFSLFKRNIIYKFKKKTLIDTDNVSKQSLDELFHYYGSDKANIFKKTNKQGHGYSDFYTNQLDNLKKIENISYSIQCYFCEYKQKAFLIKR